MSDTIADMLTRLRNAVAAKHKTVDVKNSRICQGIASVLKEEGYIIDFAILDDGTKQGLIRITIKYTPTGEQVLRELKRVSKPGCRVYREREGISPGAPGPGHCGALHEPRRCSATARPGRRTSAANCWRL